MSSLFPEPFSGYNLSPSSGAVGSVPPGAISLPFGLTPSVTDLAGNTRTGDGVDPCFTAQDKGALELQGHLVTCPSAPIPGMAGGPKPVVGVITALAINPSSFAAAPSGATISRAAVARKKGKKRYGARISYRDSQIATSTFTVLREEPGRRQGKSCKKRSKSNKHGKRCTLFKAIGAFSHADVAGANSLHFSGRLNGRKLAKGPYRLQAVSRDAAGNGPPASTSFKIK